MLTGITKETGENGVPHGKGVLIFYRDSGRYEGDFVNGAATGKGKIVYRKNGEDGDVYEGGMKDNYAHGKGVFTYRNDPTVLRYVGEFKKGTEEGSGIIFFRNGDRYEGEFKDGRLHGKGKYLVANGDYYEGDFCDNRMEGFGTFVWTSGARYDGEFRNKWINGKGKLKDEYGTTFEGEFVDGISNGETKATLPDKTYIITTITNEKPKGYAEYFNEKGELLMKGVWEGEVLVGDLKSIRITFRERPSPRK